MYKQDLRFSMRKRSAALLALLLSLTVVLPLCPIYAAEDEPLPTAEGDLPEDFTVWSGEKAYSFVSGSGSRYDPYLIDSAEALALLADSVNKGEGYSGKYFKLATDLYLNDPSHYFDRENTPPLNEWTPIGGYQSLTVTDENAYGEALAEYGTLYLRTEEGYTPADGYIKNAIYYHLAAFSGHFDGDGHGIYGLYLSTEEPSVGLFGACKDATIVKLSLENAYINASDEVGGLVGRFDAENTGSIDQCHVSADITASGDKVGGLVGVYSAGSDTATLSVTACSASGSLQAADKVGGLIGSAEYIDAAAALQLENCRSDSSITAVNAAGGIIGALSLPATLLGCVGGGSIEATYGLGGIVGVIASKVGYITVSDCQNNASLVGQTAVGGIAGSCTTEPEKSAAERTSDSENEVVIEVLGASNLGDLFGIESAGGIVGSATTVGNTKIDLIGCKNSAAVSGVQRIGGIAGRLSAEGGLLTVGSAENYGAVSADRLVGGIAGEVDAGAEMTLYQCFSYAAVTAAKQYAGGIAGRLTVGESGNLLLELSCTNGSVKAAGYAGGIVGLQTADHASARSLLTNCFSYALITAEENAGGIAGAIEAISGQTTINSSLFIGSFASGGKLSGGIAAYAHAKNADATVQIDQCYYQQSAAARPALLYGGAGSEICQSTVGLDDEALKNTEQLVGLDFDQIWQPTDEENIYPTLRALPFIWESFHYTVSGKSATLIAYQGRSDIVVVPAKLGGMSVTTIADSAFRGSSMIEVVLPDSVTTIGEFAFADCKELRSITLSSELRTVGASAFKNCSALEEKRSASALADLYTGSDNDSFASLPIIQPVALRVDYAYENGAVAALSTQMSCYLGDHYLIDAPSINGYEAELSTLVGICRQSETIGVVYRPGSYSLTVRYLFPDGSEAAESYRATYRFGEPYSIPSPDVVGYLPANSLLEGHMEGGDLELTVYYSEQLVSASPEHPANQSLLIVLLICASFALLCCIAYFIFRYRSHHAKEEEPEFDSLFKRRF